MGRRVAEVPIPADRCQAHLVAAVTEHLEAGRRVAEVPIPADRCQAHLVAATEAAETAAGHQVADRAEATPEADRVAALPVADTITANDFHPVSPHSSLTVRRLRKGPPALPEH